MGIRIAADVIIFTCIFIAPFWLTAILGIVSLFLFPRYYEIIFFGFLSDALYLPVLGSIIITPILFSAILAYMLSVFIKPRVRMFV